MKLLDDLKLWREGRRQRKLLAEAERAIRRKDWARNITPKVLRWMRESGALILVCFISSCGMTPARAEGVDLLIIAQIESSGNPLAVSYAGAENGRGLYQISEIALEDYNIAHPASKIAVNALFNPVEARKVAEWYISRIKQILARRGVSAKIRHILISYNWGVGNCVKWVRTGSDFSKLPRETRSYIAKYNRLAGAK
jgi:hypothetical protein